ncbi:unnamed protein product [Heterobilharzia americana]|nr:unnamed protein product [Heterobilharzia americana]
MEDTTSYRRDFIPKKCSLVEPIKPIEHIGCLVKFDGSSTYKSDYRTWDISPITLVKPNYEKGELPKFNAEPTYRREFIPYILYKKVDSFKPLHLPKVYDEPFKGDTIYRTEYVTPPPPTKPQTSPKPKMIAKSTVPLDTLTTFRKDFTPKEICLNPPFKPNQMLITSKDPLSEMTTNRIDYKDWGYQPTERRIAPSYQPTQGDRYLDSTYRKDFPEKPICPATLVKPFEVKKCYAKFDGTTNYRNDYVPWSVKNEHVKAPISWTPPTAPLDRDTTNRRDFVPYNCIQPEKLFKPSMNITVNGSFNDQTNYRTDYVLKKCPTCPAQFLNQEKISPDGYQFSRFDEGGHQLYQYIGTGKVTLPQLQVK